MQRCQVMGRVTGHNNILLDEMQRGGVVVSLVRPAWFTLFGLLHDHMGQVGA